MEYLTEFSQGNLKFKYKFSSTTRRYIGVEQMATLLGVLLNLGYIDFSNLHGNPGDSTSHINGDAGDILYINTKKENKTTLLTDTDFDRMKKVTSTLHDFRWGTSKKPMLSENFELDGVTTRLPNTIHYKVQTKKWKMDKTSPSFTY